MIENKSFGIITFPINKNGVIPLANLVEIIVKLCPKTYLITGNEGYKKFQNDKRIKVYNITHTGANNIFIMAFKYVLIQIRIAKIIITSKEVSRWIFFIGGSSLIIPLLTAKIMGKNTYLLLAGSEKKGADVSHTFLALPLKLLIEIGYSVTDKIIIYSPSLIKLWNLVKHRNKILIAHEHFLDFNFFKTTTSLPDRPHLIGFIGTLSEVKGIQNFTKALPIIIKENHDLSVLICGDGPLRDEIKQYLQIKGLLGRVNLLGWITHDELPKYLNQLQLLILPSYSEGLPNIILEAMACGTPVLATPVGSIPDVIIDGKTGFIMENNEPDCIAENVKRALNNHNLEMIVVNEKKLLENFTFEITVKKWERVLELKNVE